MNVKRKAIERGTRLVVIVSDDLVLAVERRVEALSRSGVRHTRSDVIRKALIAFLEKEEAS